MIETWRRERKIRQVLRGLARQRVAIVHRGSGIWVIECAMARNDEVEADLATCLMRGWVEALQENMPTGTLEFDSTGRAADPRFDRIENHFRLTDGGWAALNRAHVWTVIGVIVALASLAATFAVAS